MAAPVDPHEVGDELLDPGDELDGSAGLASLWKDEEQHAAGERHRGHGQYAEAVHAAGQAPARAALRASALHQETDVRLHAAPGLAGPREEMGEAAIGVAHEAPA